MTYVAGPILLLAVGVASSMAAEVETPKSLDERLAIELFAAEPDVVTVTGLTVDGKGRVLVVESHTHFRPENYQGPATDRIRLLEDTDGDGRADRVETFFSGTTSTMAEKMSTSAPSISRNTSSNNRNVVWLDTSPDTEASRSCGTPALIM